jgi:hypothetical protein
MVRFGRTEGTVGDLPVGRARSAIEPLLVVAAALAAFARNDFGIVLKGAVWTKVYRYQSSTFIAPLPAATMCYAVRNRDQT